MKRPRLALNANAKIATKVRQRYLDAFIDEHMKMDIPPQEAYKKACVSLICNLGTLSVHVMVVSRLWKKRKNCLRTAKTVEVLT